MEGRPQFPERSQPGRQNGKDLISPNGVTGHDAGEDEISLRDILDMLMKGKWMILATFFAVLALVSAYTFTVSPEYESASTILINTQQPAVASLDAILAFGAGNRSVHNEVEILRSRSLAERVADRLLQAGSVPGVDVPLTILEADAETTLVAAEVAERLRKKYVQIRPMGRDVDMVEVKATSTVPEEAAFIAQLYAVEYERRNLEASRSRMNASRQFLEDQEAQYSQELRAAEEALRVFLEQEGVVALDEEAKQLVSQSAVVQSLRDQAQVELEMARARLGALEREVEQIQPGLARRISSGLEREISALQNEIAQLELRAERIYSRYPELRGNESESIELAETLEQINSLRSQVETRAVLYVDEVMAAGGIEPQAALRMGDGSTAQGTLGYVTALQRQITDNNIEVSGHEARVAVLAERAAEYERQFDRIPRTSIRLAQLQRARQANEQLYLFLVEKLQEARVAEQSELGYVEIIDQAAVPRDPVRPRKALNLLLGAIVGFMLGIGLVFVRNAMDNLVRRPEDLRQFGHEVIGVIPNMKQTIKSDFDGKERIKVDDRSVSTTLITLLNPLSPIAEAYRRLRTNVQFSKPDSVVQTVLITSAGPGEGKTNTAMNLAITMAQAGRRTLYVDADLRRPAGHKAMGIPRDPGLVELLFDTHNLEIEQFTTSVDSLFVIPAGNSVPNPSELLGSRKMRDFILRLRNEFDVIIIDTPPVLPVTDAVLLSTQCDACILVASANETDRYAVQRSLESLKSVNAPIIGSVLNKFDPRAAYGAYSYSYGYGYGYQEYYGESKQRSIKSA